MTPPRIWRGVRMRDTAAGADPDAPPRPLSLPAAWDDRAAAALAALAPGAGRATLPRAAEGWIRPLAARAHQAGGAALADRLHALLLHRRAAPTEPVWGLMGTAADVPGFVLNLPAFHDGAHGFDAAGFADAVTTAATALHLGYPGGARFALGITDLDGLLAVLGLEYDSPAARDVARAIAALLRATADLAFAGNQPDLLSRHPSWPLPPSGTAVPGLAAAADDARQAALRGASGLPSTAILPPGPADALLGAETGGIAPAFSAVGPDGALTRAAAARLAALGLSADAALARVLSGEAVLPAPGLQAHQAMHDAVAPYLHAMPPRPVPGAIPAQPPRRRELPARRRGYTQKAAVGGHRVWVRTGEYPDGTLGELHVSLPREGAALRGMMDSMMTAVSLGLQHGVPLADYVAAFTLTRFGPAGRVEGDADVGHATSILDYVFRNLAINYLGHCPVPEGIPEPVAPDPAPLLPMDLPSQPRTRRPGLRLVANG
jgi:ribonucleoside-diphosphate reductase alpha chain